jgi:hypothetical protein
MPNKQQLKDCISISFESRFWECSSVENEPIFLLGEYVFSALSQGVENFYEAACKAAQQWTVDFMVQKFLDVMVLVNPHLSHHQQALLKPLFHRALDQLIWQRALEPRVIRGLVALACPNQDTGFLFGYLMEIIVGLLCGSSQSHEALDLKSSQMDAGSAAPSFLQVCLFLKVRKLMLFFVLPPCI